MTYSSWVSNGTNVAYEPKEKNTGEVITSFSTTAPGGVPNSSYAPSTYVLAASGAWIAQTVATAASEVRRPSVYTELTGNPSPYFIATNTNLVYDADANHITTYGAFELAGLQVQNDASFTYTVFQTKAQTWTSCTLNISRNYASTQWTSGTEARFYLSTDSGSNWTLLLTDDYDSDPITVAIFSHTLSTVNPSSLSAYQVKVEIDAFPSSAFNSVGVLYLQLYDIWIEGIYAVSGGSGTVTSITTTGANGVTISGGSTQTITTSGTFALALGAITPTSIVTGTGSFSGDVEFASSIKSPNGSNSPVTIAPDGTGDVHLNTDSVRIGDNNADATIATRGTGDLIITTHEGSAVEGIVRLYDGANGNITLTPNGSGQVKVGTDQVVTLVASQTLTNKTISGSTNTLSNIANASLTNSTISGVALGSNLNALTISSPLTGTSYNGSSAVSIGIPVATTSVNGYLSSTDWTTFNNKGSGSVTSVAATVPSLLSISGSPITTSGTLAITYSGTALPVANGGTGLTTLTAGYIPYGAGTSAFGSSANLFWDSANSRLGIGTTSPSYTLEVYKPSSTANLAVTSASTGTADFSDFRVIGNDVTARISAYGSNHTARGSQVWVNANTNTPLILATNNTERVRIDSSGNVGIGTATSSGLLTLKNNPSGSAENVLIGLQQNGASTGTIGKLSYQQSDDTMRLYNSSSFAGSALILGTNNTERVRIDSSGNVLVATGSNYTSSKLQVYGNIDLVNTSSSQFIRFYDGTTFRGGLGTDEWVGGSSANLTLVSNGDSVFRTTGSATERMRIVGSTGNVGIGTASPTVGLHVVKDQGSGYIAAFRSNVSSPYITFQTTSSITQIQGINSAFSATNDIAMQLSGGNVGIGTASPSAKLHVSGNTISSNFYIPAGSAGTYGLADLSSAIQTYSGSVSPVNSMLFYSNGSERMRIDSTQVKATVPFIGNSGTKGFGGITTTTSTSTPTGGSSGDHYYIY